MKALDLVNLLLENSGVYVSAVLTPESQRRLLQRVPPVHPDVKADHMTISFNPPPERIRNYYQASVGQRMRIRVVGVAQDDKGQAVRVEGDSENANPHVTISVADGVSSAYSNELLAQGWKPMPPFSLDAIIAIEPI